MLKKEKQLGFIAILASLLIVLAMTTLALAVLDMAHTDYKTARKFIQSAQAYFTAESGVQDAILRIRKGEVLPANYAFTVEGDPVNVTIANVGGSSVTIESEGEEDNVFKKIKVIQTLDSANVQFFFGAQVGAGGMNMSNNSQVQGNVFANGNILGSNGNTITGGVVVANNGNRIEDVTVGGDVRVHNCKDSTVQGDLYYVAGGSLINCNVNGDTFVLPMAISPEALPISAAQITEWKDLAEAGGVWAGNYTFTNNQSKIAGPLKITGNLIFANNNTLTMTGVVWVVGNVITGNNTVIELDNGVFGASSGVLVADGIIDLANNANIKGTGQPGSYLMLLTTSPANPAMNVRNNSTAGIFYASNGFVNIANNAFLREVTAYGLNLANNVIVQYEVGLANLFFSSGPGGGWAVDSWQEIE